MQAKTQKKFSFFLILFTLFACDNNKKIDSDGGYYDEKTKTYRYVFPNKKGLDLAHQKVKKPRKGEIQKIFGIVSKIDSSKSLWIRLKDRQTYMILARDLAADQKDDEKKEFRVIFNYVSPKSSSIKKGKFLKQWTTYVKQRLEREILAKQVLVVFAYEEIAHQFRGNIIASKDRKSSRNINLWMIYEGLSYYFYNHGLAKNHQIFLSAQKKAKKKKNGIWKYQ